MPEDTTQNFPIDQIPDQQQEDIWYRSEMWKVLDKIVEDKQTEEKLAKFPLWAGGTKSMKLTFFDNIDVRVMENLWEAEVCRYLRSLPPSQQNHATYLTLGQARLIFMTNVRRSLGTPVQKINERIAILSQWKINTPAEFAPQPKPGIFKRIFG